LASESFLVKKTICGEPIPALVGTSYVERYNLTARMGIRRLTRLTNGFSKKVENHRAAIAIFIAYYNFVRLHRSLRTTPAMAAGIEPSVWSMGDLLEIAETLCSRARSRPFPATDIREISTA